ncbi:MAG: DUF3570 domain-containing protein [Methylococcales bacterium]|nr:DUF3570 domain-containing protein [Methylococcales bacterium]MDD5630556.1 DUF3570 domain-containing protein [Methylococcales bacterium]
MNKLIPCRACQTRDDRNHDVAVPPEPLGYIHKRPVKGFDQLQSRAGDSVTQSFQLAGRASPRPSGLKRFLAKAECPSLQALTTAALLLPGLIASPVYAAEGDEVDFQYGHYQETKRNIYGLATDPVTGVDSVSKLKNGLNPIEVDSLHGSAKIALSDRVKFAFNYLQDTWGGATPVSSAPAAWGVNQPLLSQIDQTVAGATPWLQGTTKSGRAAVDGQGRPLVVNSNTNPESAATWAYTPNNQLTDILASASPETRNQGDFKLAYEWDQAAISAGAGISSERDYESRFGNIGGLWNFNQKHTTLNLGLSYTNSNTHAVLNHDSYPYIDSTAYRDNGQIQTNADRAGANILYGNRQDWGTNFGITQIVNKDALVSGDISFTRSTGYLANPYKAVNVLFVDPVAQADNPPNVFTGELKALLEKRPDQRNQFNVGGRYVQFINPINAALHFDYHFSSDDWGIQGHTFEADWAQPVGNGWVVTPRIRYYSQNTANFYTPYLVNNQAYSTTSSVIDPVRGQAYKDASGQVFFEDPTAAITAVTTTITQELLLDENGIPVFDANGNPVFIDVTTTTPILDANGQPTYTDKSGNPIPVDPATGFAVVDANGKIVTDANIINGLTAKTQTKPFDPGKLPANYSSDERLAGFGALSGGVTISKQFAKGLSLETGFEYYTHQASLKIGGGSANSFNNFDSWNVNAALKVNMEALSLARSTGDNVHAGHEHHHGAHEPAGVMYGHMLPKAGDMMVGYRYMYGSQSGDTLHNSRKVYDPDIVANGCGPNPCFIKAGNMSMNMHMLDLMYAPTDWLTLMLMPQFVSMSMTMDALAGAPSAPTFQEIGMLEHHLQNGHQSGGIGDLGMYALFKLFDNGTHHVHVTTGISAPTGAVDLKLNRNHQLDGGFMDYGMQLGSGTWDFKPSLTYTGQWQQFSWGAQSSGTVRMENRNQSGYALGDLFQTTAWGSYNFTNWLAGSLRGLYTAQGAIKGQYNGFINKFGPMDYPANYGGNYWDIGFGLSAMVPSGDWAGNRVSVEWLQPVLDNVNGYQLQRDGSLSATWSVAF